jgi:hypothetical protein
MNGDEMEHWLSGVSLTAADAPRAAEALLEQLRLVSDWLSRVELSGSGAALLSESDGKLHACPLATGGDLIVGRGAGCGLCFPDNDRLSRRHFRIFHDGAGWQLEDLGSRNGTRFGGRSDRVQRAALRDGDVIAAGGRRFIFVIRGDADEAVR